MLGNSSSSDRYVFWLVSTPRANSEYDTIKMRCKPLVRHLSPFEIPSTLKVGTIDELYGLSDDLIKVDTFIEGVTKKILRQTKDLVAEEAKDKNAKTDIKSIFTVGNVNVETHMRSWDWNNAKYKTTTSLRELTESISSEMSSLDEELRNMQSEYISVGHAIESYERGKSGNLAVRDLSEVITEKNYVQSKHLTTLFVLVPKHSEKEWDNTYETLSEGVVPRSSQSILTDGDTVLRNVVLFKTSVEEFKGKVQRKKWTVREVAFDKESLADKKDKLEEHKERRKQLRADLIRWARTNFSEAFNAWVHLKTIRVFVESVLRFGLPRDFNVMVMEPNQKDEKKLRSTLDEVYKKLGNEYLSGDTGDVVIAGITEKFYPYVFAEIDLTSS
jgi:V-type H+-transporting ATPase subunit C